MAQLGGGKGGQKLKDLEAKAKEFEVLGNIDLDKLLHLVEKKEKRIRTLEQVEKDNISTIDHAIKMAGTKVKKAHYQKSIETRLKEEALESIA
jgi:hypothetical protein